MEIYIIIIVIIIFFLFFFHRRSLPGTSLELLLNQRWSPPLRLQVSHCSISCIMCDVPRTAVFCSECTECFPGMASTFFLKHFVIFRWIQLLPV